MKTVFVVFRFDSARGDYVPTSLWSKREDADAQREEDQKDQPTEAAWIVVASRTLDQAIDEFVKYRLAGLGLELAIVEKSVAA